jgi:hypothetical protein
MEFDHVGLHLQPDLPPVLQKLSGRSAKAAGAGLMTLCPLLFNGPLGFWSMGMSVAIARIFPHASAASLANIDTFIRVALFSGVGLLLSLSVLILDQYIPGEWF